MLSFLKAILYTPLYNILIILIGVVGGNVGLAIILLTILVKLVLFPLTQKSIVVQAKMKAIQPELDAIKKDFPDKQEQAKKTFELYAKNKVNPFSSCLVVLIQFPIIIALYYVFLKGLPDFTGTLYSFVHAPANISMHFLGVNIQKPNIIFALLAGFTQFIQAYLASKSTQSPAKGDGSFKDEMMKSLQIQMKYILPIFIALIGMRIAAAVALYWITTNIFTIAQEFWVRKNAKKFGIVTTQ